MAFRDLIEVERPPGWVSEAHGRIHVQHTFIYEHDQTEIPKLLNSCLHAAIEPFCARSTPENADEELTDETAIQDFVQTNIDDVQGQQESGQVEHCRYGRFMIGKCCFRLISGHARYC